MEQPGKQLFIFPDESGGNMQKRSAEDLSPPEKIRKDMLYTDLQKLKDTFGEINNTALLEGGYFRRSSKFIQQEIDWINEFVGDNVVQISNLDHNRMTWVPKLSDDDSRSVQEAA